MMSSGTQIELDWAGAGTPPSGGSTPQTQTETYPSDEEILGIDSTSPNSAYGEQSRRDSGDRMRQDNDMLKPASEKTADDAARASGEPGSPGNDTEDLRAFREMFPGGADQARALRESARDLESMREAARSVDRIDAAIFSGDAKAQAEVVAELARANPGAFRQLFAEAEKVLSALPGSGPPSAQGSAQPPVTTQPQSQQPAPRAPAFDPAAYAAFERATNDAVARDVRAAISDTLARVLPEGVAEGAARRIGDDIFNEIHRTLASDQALSAQVGDVLSGRRFGMAEQQRVASLLAGRARQVAPAVARRVIGEWTSSVLSTARTRAERQAAAAARVDIAAPGGSLDSMPLRPMSPREIDYARMSDDEILSL
jgi:hypothetical protein